MIEKNSFFTQNSEDNIEFKIVNYMKTGTKSSEGNTTLNLNTKSSESDKITNVTTTASNMIVTENAHNDTIKEDPNEYTSEQKSSNDDKERPSRSNSHKT